MPYIYYGFYFNDEDPTDCKAVKRIEQYSVPEGSMPQFFDEQYTDVMGKVWNFVGCIMEVDE